jgi:hypothetical protein
MNPDEPRVVRVIREYRQAMAAKELEVMEDMAKRWLEIEKRLDGDIAALQAVMAQRAGEGKAITQQMIWKEERYKILKGNLEDALKAYNRDYLIEKIGTSQGEFGMLGIQSASDAIRASYMVGFGPNFKVLNESALQTMIGYLGNGSPLNSLLKLDYPDALDGLTNALINGIARGSSPVQVAAEMTQGMGGGLDRALLIARTEMSRTYRSAQSQEYAESGVVMGFRRLVNKGTACMACLMLDGEHFDKGKELDDHPAGKCQAVPEVVGVGAPKWQTGQDWFVTLSPEEQEAKLGPELYEQWKAGEVDLTDLVSKQDSAEWGKTPRWNAGG